MSPPSFAICQQLIEQIWRKLQRPAVGGHTLGGASDDFLEPLRRHRPQLTEQFECGSASSGRVCSPPKRSLRIVAATIMSSRDRLREARPVLASAARNRFSRSALRRVTTTPLLDPTARRSLVAIRSRPRRETAIERLLAVRPTAGGLRWDLRHTPPSMSSSGGSARSLSCRAE